jgi:3-oxoacyl-[acyl-carrier protein] reductase
MNSPVSSPVYDNEVIWLTGSASGVGKHLTSAFVRKGYYVVATDINIDALKNIAETETWPTDRLMITQLDIRSADQWQQIFDQILAKWGRLDRLFNIAGYLKPGYIHQTAKEEIDKHIDINLKGLILGSQLVAQHFVKQRKGHIINIASLAGIAPIPGISLYSTSKFAVRGFSLALAQELYPYNVAVTVICPDAIQTPMLSLQEHYDEAAMTFSGPKALNVEDIEQAVFNKVLQKYPLELMLPQQRGMLAKLGNAFPSITLHLGKHLRKKGLNAQKSRRKVT